MAILPPCPSSPERQERRLSASAENYIASLS
nr:MAG TPA: hypothetical protein [Caudoviricetes sp.]